MCRVAYELKMAMEENFVDASEKVLSLDIPHHYAWIRPASRKAIYNHNLKTLKEISFSTGDILTHKDDHTTIHAARKGKVMDGFMRMLNKKHDTEGLIPIYKTSEIFPLTDLSEN